MRRQARTDAPGVLHVVCRGKERRYWLQTRDYDINRVKEKAAKVFAMETIGNSTIAGKGK